jgi:hypothetical protein
VHHSKSGGQCLSWVTFGKGIEGKCPLTLRVFGRLPFTGVRARTEAGVGKAWKEETAGEFAPTLVSIYGEFAGAG